MASPIRHTSLGLNSCQSVLRRPIRTTTPILMGRRSAKIAQRKGKSDAKKAKLYGRFGKQIQQAVRSGGAGTDNARLQDILRQAKLVSVPNDIIERNIKKANDSKSVAEFNEAIYEAYGPGGTAFVIECLTDNPNRTSSDVKTAVTKGGGKWADSGSVLFNFQRQGVVRVNKGISEEKIFDLAIEAGADDVQPAEDGDGMPDGYRVISSLESFGEVRAALTDAGVDVSQEDSGLVWAPLATVEVDDQAFQENEALFERLMEVDDVDSVFSNCDGIEA
uniref:Duf28-domain-containing protein n=1 Tax=Tetraselmis sp. GSL018 TaxID=582737 RepID=A0A061R912_9CHLO